MLQQKVYDTQFKVKTVTEQLKRAQQDEHDTKDQLKQFADQVKYYKNLLLEESNGGVTLCQEELSVIWRR